MSLATKFDAIYKNAMPKDIKSGYEVSGRIYEAYQENNDWQNFLTKMMYLYPNAYVEYSAGGGGELEAKSGKPPKMASFTSSSRMIYLLARDCSGFDFEVKLPTTVGGTANLDGFLKQADKYIFVEAKCREPYNHSATITVSNKYRGFYEYVNRNFEDININISPAKKANEIKVEFFINNIKIEFFDIKQMLSHLCGIATACLKGYYTDKSIEFVYLLYNPTLITEDADIIKIYNETCEQCHSFDFSALFSCVVDYLISCKGFECNNEKIEAVKSAFSFVLYDQNEFKERIFEKN